MSILQDVSHVTGNSETECFILLCMQSCKAEFTLNQEGAAKDNVCMAYTAPVEDEGDYDGTSDMSK
mgnify:CR=1 FL=1|jgi:hypothetical protein